MSVVYDTGVLVAADRNDRTVWADHRVRLEIGVLPRTTAPVVAQVSRSAQQAQLQRFLRGCEIEAFSPAQAHEVGALMGRAGTSDVVDAHLVVTAAELGSSLVTPDPDDLLQLSNHLSAPVAIRHI